MGAGKKGRRGGMNERRKGNGEERERGEKRLSVEK